MVSLEYYFINSFYYLYFIKKKGDKMKPSTYILDTSKTQIKAMERMKKVLDYYLCVADVKAIEEHLKKKDL